MENKVTATRAEKKERVKNLIKEVLKDKEYKHNDLIEQSASLYIERFENDTDNINDVKGRIGSVLDIMKKESEVQFEGGVYALNVKKVEEIPAPSEKKEKKTTKKKTVKEETKIEMVVEEKAEKPAKAKKTATKRTKKVEIKAEAAEEKEKEKIQPLPPPPIQPIAPTAPTSPEVAPTPEKKTTKRGRAKKAEKVKEVIIQESPVVEGKEETTVKAEQEIKSGEEVEKSVEVPTTALTETKKGELAPKAAVMDMSFLFGVSKPIKEEKKQSQKVEVKEEVKKSETVLEKKEEKKVEKEPVKQAKLQTPILHSQEKQEKEPSNRRKIPLKKTVKVLTADEKLKELFLKKIRALGGDYFEYYSVYLLEKYSRMNGRRLEGLRISAGDHDGGIDGEIELTDKLGFRETIYIQSKNWNPEKGDERLWVVGETLLQQFIGACACRQAKEGKQHCRGIFITTSRFTPEAKRILQDMSDKIVGYDGEDLYETAKECSFGLVKKNGEWALDEQLLSGEKAFFSML